MKLLKNIILLAVVFGFIVGCSNPVITDGRNVITTIEVFEDDKIDTSRLNLGLYIAERELSQRVESGSSYWNEKSAISGYYPIYTPGIEGVSHYEFKVKTDDKDTGYILVSVTENDIEIPEMAEEGLTVTETYKNALNTDAFKVVRFNWFESSAESTTRGIETKVLATIGFNGVGLTLIDQTRGDNSFESRYADIKKDYTEKLKEKQCLPYYNKEHLKKVYDERQRSNITRGEPAPIPQVVTEECKLKNYFGNGWNMPSWTQSENDGGYPVGCASTAWAMVYAYWHQFKGKKKLFGNDLKSSVPYYYVTDFVNNLSAENKKIVEYCYPNTGYYRALKTGLSLDMYTKLYNIVNNSLFTQPRDLKSSSYKLDIHMSDPNNHYYRYWEACQKTNYIPLDPIWKMQWELASNTETYNSYYLKVIGGNIFFGGLIYGEEKYGLTWPDKLEQGKKYAEKFGYSVPTQRKNIVANWTEGMNFVWESISDDRPMILLFATEGLIANHYVAIEEVKKRFWNSTGWATELGMLCNFGWGGTRKWIYAFTDTWQTTNACYDLYDIKIQ